MIWDFIKRRWHQIAASPPEEAKARTKSLGKRTGFGGMIIGMRYDVIREFTDFDGGVHRVGESWVFKGDSFLPYEDGQSLYVEDDSSKTIVIPLQLRKDAQGELARTWDRYVRQSDKA